MAENSSVDLSYRIASCTDYSRKYVPEHILVDAPTDQTSRWSGANQTANSKQWIILELLQPSLVHSITFGKFYKTHPCNMKEFKVYTGRTIDSLCLVLHAGLKNDGIPETFPLSRTNKAGLECPIYFIKIVPLSAHNPSYNTSIWYVGLKGINDENVVKTAEKEYASYKETSAIRHVLKYLRQRRHFSAFHALQTKARIALEDPIVTKLYECLMSGDWSLVESLIKTIADCGLFDGYINAGDPKALWMRLNGANADGDVPSPRGGHQLCIDIEAGLIYLFGGWDGEKNLDDLWTYSVSEGRWKMLSSSTALDGGPGPRSCHKMVFDPLLGYIYLLGCLPDEEGSPSFSNAATSEKPRGDTVSTATTTGSAAARVAGPEGGPKALPSDFYRYTTRGPNAGKWTVLSENTASEDGPPLLYDHQMEIDAEKQLLYVFGGRIINEDQESGALGCSGLYRYHIDTGKWEHLLYESALSNVPRMIPSRHGHSMVFDARSQRLFIFAGKRGNDYLPDMYTYDTKSQEVIEVARDFSVSGGPDPCFYQRAVIDPESSHIYLLPGLLKPKGQRNSQTDGILRSTFWIYKHEHMKWSRVENYHTQADDSDWDTTEIVHQPLPRYGHQMVYDPSRKEFFIHGGNSGQEGNKRLDDFWSMKFERPSRDEMIRRATFIVRRQQFKELCETVPAAEALTFLQREVHAVVDHLSDEETATFRALHSHLFSSAVPSFLRAKGNNTEDDVDMSTDPNTGAILRRRKLMPPTPDLNKDIMEGDDNPQLTPERFQQRTQVFESLLELVDDDAKQPTTDLVDLVDGLQAESQ